MHVTTVASSKLNTVLLARLAKEFSITKTTIDIIHLPSSEEVSPPCYPPTQAH